MAQKSFKWKNETLFKNVKGFEERADRVITAAFDYQATRSETFMKKNAPWKDDTSNARNGLFTATKHEGSKHFLLLSHGVEYGIWLELIQSGKYGIVKKAWLVGIDELRGRIEKIFGAIVKMK